MGLLVYCLYYVILRYVSHGISVDIARETKGDIVTNQICLDDVCRQNGGACINRHQCQCTYDKTTFLRRQGRCVSNEALTATLHRGRGCSYRLVANDYQDSRQRGRVPCTFEKLSLRALDQTVSGSQLIDVCNIFTWAIKSCAITSGAYYDGGDWKDIWTAGSNQTIFSIVKRYRLGVASAIYLEWNTTLPQRFHGYIISLDVGCKRKFNQSDVQSCLLFKVKSAKINHRFAPSTSTSPPMNNTATPTVLAKHGIHVPKSRDSTTIIIVGVLCGLFAVAIVAILVYCFKKRPLVLLKHWKKRKQQKQQTAAMTSSPLYDINEYQSAHEHEPPVYTTPSKPGYQDLVFKPSPYQPLVAKTSIATPESPIYHTLEEPDNQSDDVTPHIYHVVEGPS